MKKEGKRREKREKEVKRGKGEKMGKLGENREIGKKKKETILPNLTNSQLEPFYFGPLEPGMLEKKYLEPEPL